MLDDLNQGIIAALQSHPGRTNKDIGDELGVSEVTIAARIRAMEQSNTLRVMMQRDVRTMGYHLMALVDINVEGRKPEEVAHELAAIDQCTSVTVVMSNPDIILHVIARDGADLQRLVEDQIAPIPGIIAYEIMTALEVVKMDRRYGGLDIR